MGRRPVQRKGGLSTFEQTLIQGVMERQRGGKPQKLVRPTEVPPAPAAVTKPISGVPSKYLTAVGAYQYLGISKATFFRLKKQGRFSPSPVTNRYHVDDLDNEVRGKAVQDGQDQKN